MGLYNIAVYGDDVYGEAPKLSFSVEPVLASASTFDSVTVSWTKPSGEFTDMRLVRSQDGFAETAEDGVILWSSKTNGMQTSIIDGPSLGVPPLIKGRFVYYRFWVKKTDGIWAISGNAYTVVPKEHFNNLHVDPKTRFETSHEPYITIMPNTSLATQANVSLSFNNAIQTPLTATGFAVLVNGVSQTVASTTVSNIDSRILVLTIDLDNPIKDLDKVTVTYTPDGTHTLYTLHTDHSGATEPVPVIAFSSSKVASNKYSEEIALSTQDRLMDFIPRVFTSSSQSPIDEVDKTSDLWKFLEGLSFTLDEMMTLLDLTLPEESGRFWSPEVLKLMSIQYGLPLEPFLATKIQKRLVREAFYFNPRKGTELGIGTFAESITGFAPVISVSPNLLLSPQDCTFYKGTGYWVGTGIQEMLMGNVNLNEVEAADHDYILVSPNSGSISLGKDKPTLHGIPVFGAKDYELSFYTYSANGGSVTATVDWYDWAGNLLDSATYSQSQVFSSLSTSTFQKKTVQLRSPGIGNQFHVSQLTVGPSKTLTLVTDEISDITPYGVANLNNLNLTDEQTSTLANYTYTVTNVVGNVVTLQKDGIAPFDFSGTYAVDAEVQQYDNPARYAAITLDYLNASNYLDMVSLHEAQYMGNYQEARATKVVLSPSKVNYIADPTFLGGTSWDGGTITPYAMSTLGELTSPRSISTTVNSTEGPVIDYTTQQSFTASVFNGNAVWNFAGPVVPNSTVTITIEAINPADSSVIVSASGTANYLAATKEAVRAVATITVPGGDIPYLLQVTIESDADCVLSGPQLENNYVATDYFYGDINASYADAAKWYGASNASASLFYPGRAIKMTRLAEEIVNHTPFNSAYAIYTIGADATAALERKGFSY